MKKILRWLARPILWLFTCAIPVVIAACYGVYEDQFSPSGNVVDKDTGKGIGNIKVTCLTSDDEATDETYSLPGDGYFELHVPFVEDCKKIRFEDIDQEENGGQFSDLTITRESSNDFEQISAELEKAE